MTTSITIERLAAKGRLAQEENAPELDWGQEPRVPVFMTRRKYHWFIAQLQYGEEFASQTCAALGRRITDPEARAFLLTQELDERRHAEFYRRYLEKLTPVPAPSSILAGSYSRIRSWDGAHEAVILACHILLEGRYLKLQNSIPSWSRCNLFKDISAAVARDEARHFAFGRFYLRSVLPRLSRSERLNTCRWIRQLWEHASTLLAGHLSPLGSTMMATRHQRWRSRQWRQILADLQAAGLFTPQEQEAFLRL